MGALPDREPPLGAARRRPEAAPSLWSVPGQRPEPAPEPTPPPAPHPVPPPETAPAPEPEPTPEPEQVPADAAGPETEQAPELEEHERPERHSRLRPPDIWNTPAPTLREEIARVRAGDHLPASGPWRAAEQARMWVSVLLIAGLLLLVHINRSAARQAVAALLVVAVVIAIR